MIAWPSRRPRPLTATAMVLLGVAGCGGEGQTDPSDVTEITLDNDQLALDAAGQARQLNATARDADGSAVNVTIEWSSSEVDVVTVEGDGLLVAQGPGTAEVTAAVGSVNATATVVVNSTATLEVFDGNGQTAPAGQPVPAAPAVRVSDAGGQPVADVRIRFQVATGSGTLTVLEAPDVGLDGDHNGDDIVDAADYVAWRKSPGDFGNDQGYDDFFAHFGEGGGGGSPSPAPEPCSIVIAVFAVGAIYMSVRRSRFASRAC